MDICNSESYIGGVNNCGEFALEVDGKDVLGKHIKDFSKEKKRMKLAELYKLLGLSKKPILRNDVKAPS
jgi:hypothetical protein